MIEPQKLIAMYQEVKRKWGRGKMRLITFQEQFIPLIKDGTKTVTRRVKTDLKQGDTVCFKAGRNGKKEGYIKILSVTKERLLDFTINRNLEEVCKELIKEGIRKPENSKVRFPTIYDMLREFKKLWYELNENSRLEINPEVYRIEFEYLVGGKNERNKI